MLFNHLKRTAIEFEEIITSTTNHQFLSQLFPRLKTPEMKQQGNFFQHSLPSLVESYKSTSHRPHTNQCSDTAAYGNATKNLLPAPLAQPWERLRTAKGPDEVAIQTVLNSLISKFQDPHFQQYQVPDVHIYSSEVLNVHLFSNFQQTEEPIHTEKAFFFIVLSISSPSSKFRDTTFSTKCLAVKNHGTQWFGLFMHNPKMQNAFVQMAQKGQVS